MGLVSQQAKAQWALTEPDPVELPFTEGIAAVFEAGRLTDQSFSTQYQTREALKASMQRLGELGGPKGEVPWPLPDSTANAALDWLDSHKDTIAALRSPDNGPPDPFLKTGEEIRQDVKRRVEEARALASRAGLGAQLVGGMGVGLTDPLNLALLPLGVGAAEGLLARVATEAGIGAVSQTAVEIASAGAKERAGVADGFGAAALRVAETAAGAGILGGIFHGAGRVAESLGFLERYRKGVAEGTIAPNRLTEEAANAVQDHLDTVPPLATAGAEAAHLDAVRAAVDVLSAPTLDGQALALRNAEERVKAWAGVMARIHGERASELLDVTATARAAGATPTDIARTAAVTARRVGDSVEVTFGSRTITLDDPELVRGKWSVSKIQKAIAARLEDAIAGEQVSRSAMEEARALSRRVTDGGIGRGEGEYFRNVRQAERAREEFGDPSLEVVRVGKQQFVLRYPEDPMGTPSIPSRTEAIGKAVDAALAADEAAPRPPVVEPSVDAPTASLPSLHETERAEFAATIEAKPDIAASVVDDAGNFRAGTARELMAESEQRATTFRDIMTCILKGGPTE